MRRPIRALLLTLALAAAVAFVVGVALDLPELRLATKGLPVLLFAAIVGLSRPDRYGRWIAIGLVASCAGDLLLEWSEGTFLAGIVAFLIAHLLYIAAFTARVAAPRLLVALPFALFAGLVYAALAPGLGELRLPVAIYAAAIASMGWRACARLGREGGHEPWWAAVGALLFMASDTLLALNKFGDPIAGARYGVIGLYWAGQLGIAVSAWSGGRER